MAKVLRIERIAPPPGAPEKPLETPMGFQMADPKLGKNRHHKEFAFYRKTLEEVAVELGNGMLLWMKQDGKRQTLISPTSLRIIYA